MAKPGYFQGVLVAAGSGYDGLEELGSLVAGQQRPWAHSLETESASVSSSAFLPDWLVLVYEGALAWRLGDFLQYTIHVRGIVPLVENDGDVVEELDVRVEGILVGLGIDEGNCVAFGSNSCQLVCSIVASNHF